MRTDLLNVGYTNAKTAKQLTGKPKPEGFINSFINSITHPKKKYIFIAITLVLAGVLFFALTASAAENDSSQTSQDEHSGTTGPAKNNSGSASDSSGSGQSGNSSSTSVNVNGESVDVPQSGSYDKTVKVPGGTVHVSGSNSSSGSSSTNNSSVNVDVH